ncbi:unnamed protein product [Parnassius apollo]|uniref:(apollo) hypothetical protein n=1 Tax=Parnassius apollo TaxID=110799 RepID=A0A8S3WRP3_PARAO|nr:unnamed protein product [Parnassius apollo]
MTILTITNKTHNNIQTSLITFGNPHSCDGKDIIICITGNPGFVEFYLEFGQELHTKTGLPVCVIGHAGHDNVSDIQSSKLQGQEHLFNLKGQLKHKLDLLDNNIDNKSKLHFVGHSIGSWLCSLPSHYDKRVLKYLNPHIFEKVLFLAYDEMDNITTLNKDGVDKVKHLTNIIYSVDDGWAPLNFMKDLMIFQPYLQMMEVNTDHAFVFKSSEFIAFIASDFIKPKISAGM